MSDRRYGRFIITRCQVDDNLVPLILATVTPLEMKRDWITDNICVLAESSDFDVLDGVHDVPFYNFVLLGEWIEHRDITGVIVGGHREHQGVKWTKSSVCDQCGSPHPMYKAFMP